MLTRGFANILLVSIVGILILGGVWYFVVKALGPKLTLHSSGSPVSLSQLSPSSGSVGTSVIITGSGFSATGNTVSFSADTVHSLSSANGGTSITFTVPSTIVPNCISGQMCSNLVAGILPGIYPITVTNASGTLSNSLDFTVTPPNAIAWETYSLDVFTFQYPADWQVKQEGAAAGGDIVISPPDPKDQNDKIVFRGRQANCDLSYPRCNYISNGGGGFFDLHTYTTDPATLGVYAKVLASFKVNGLKATIRVQGQ